MTGLQTNIFPITNLSALSSQYRLYRIRGLQPDQDEYYPNLHHITRKLSYLLKNPVTVIEREDAPHLVVRDVLGIEMPASLPLVRSTVRFDVCPETLTLDYALRTPENDAICLRFLQFLIQEPLYRNQKLWQSRAGQPFFLRDPVHLERGVGQYRGFAVRAALTPDGGLGLSVDVVHRFISERSLPAHLTRDQFRQWKGRTCIYRYGHQWFEIQVGNLSDLHMSEYEIVENGQPLPLLDYIVRESAKPIPPELAQLPHDAAVVLYHNNRNEERAAPTSLCYPIYDSHSSEGGRQHGYTILAPHQRQSLVYDFVNDYLQNLRFGNTRLFVSSEPISTPHRMFIFPDLEFGQSQILSVRGTVGAHQVSLDTLGQERLALLRDCAAGFYVRDPLDRQYFLMPRSVYDSFGQQMLKDLVKEVDKLFPPEEAGYDPIVVPYDDRGPKTFPVQGKAILDAVRTHCTKPGYAVVMIHPTTDRRIRQEDQLAAMVLRKMPDFGITAAVIHTEVGQEGYVLAHDHDGKPGYRIRHEQRSLLTGYLRGVALNSVLLTNHRWPFVLATPLHADVIIGLDVKHNIAGLILVGHNGSDIRPLYKSSRQKEQLLTEQIRDYLLEIIRLEARNRREPIRIIALHRDGRLYPSERKGAQQALEILKREGSIAADATLTLLEIPKKSPVALRLFDVTEKEERPWIENPQIGSYYLANANEGYVCTTGRAFRRRGTVRPLHVIRIEGPMPLEHCLEDIFFLSALAWTRPEDCIRDPITTKLNDRFLGEEAGEYNQDALEFQETEAENIEEEEA